MWAVSDFATQLGVPLGERSSCSEGSVILLPFPLSGGAECSQGSNTSAFVPLLVMDFTLLTNNVVLGLSFVAL
jgi:hypothetical protein